MANDEDKQVRELARELERERERRARRGRVRRGVTKTAVVGGLGTAAFFGVRALDPATNIKKFFDRLARNSRIIANRTAGIAGETVTGAFPGGRTVFRFATDVAESAASATRRFFGLR